MSVNLDCPNRIKPKLLREQKTEALLVFVRTTLEQSFSENIQQGYKNTIGTEEDTEHIYNKMQELLDNLQDCIVNSLYLRNVISVSDKSAALHSLAKKERPLMTYYNSIIKGIENNLKKGTNWIPEIIVIAILSEWIIEEEKSIVLYPFLNNIDYLDLIERIDRSKIGIPTEEKDVIMNMYKISSNLISRLKESTYKVSNKTIRKKRKK